MPSDCISTPEPDAVEDGRVEPPSPSSSFPPPQAVRISAKRHARTNPGRNTADTPSMLSGRNEDCDAFVKMNTSRILGTLWPPFPTSKYAPAPATGTPRPYHL